MNLNELSALFILNIGFLHDCKYYVQATIPVFNDMSYMAPTARAISSSREAIQLMRGFQIPSKGLDINKDLCLTTKCFKNLWGLDSKLVWQNLLWLLPFCEILWHKMALCSFDLHHKIYREYEFYLKCYSWDNPGSAQFDQSPVFSLLSLCQAAVTVSFRILVIISNYCQNDIKLCTFHKIIPQRHI